MGRKVGHSIISEDEVPHLWTESPGFYLPATNGNYSSTWTGEGEDETIGDTRSKSEVEYRSTNVVPTTPWVVVWESTTEVKR